MRAMLAGCLVFTLGAGAAAAQPAGGSGFARVSLWGAVAMAPVAAGGELATDYAPVLEGGGDYTSRASQRLPVDVGGGAGVTAGADLFFSRRVGLQAGFIYRRAALSGPGTGDYLLSLRYVARQPPDYVAREYRVDRAETWPAASGHCSFRTLLFGLAVRAGPAAGRFDATFAGGVGVSRAAADLESAAYTAFRLGGHAVLFESQNRVAVSTADAGTIVRPYVAGDIGYRVSGRASLFAGVRVRVGSIPSLAARPSRVIDPEAALWVPDLGDVERVLAMEPLLLSMPRVQAVAGLRVAIH